MTDESLEARDAVIAALTSPLSTYGTQAYSAKQLRDMGTKPVRYAEVVAVRRFIGAPRRSGTASEVTSYRATTWVVAKDEDDALLLAKAVASLENVALVVGGKPSTCVDYETSKEVTDQGDHWSGWTTWTFSA